MSGNRGNLVEKKIDLLRMSAFYCPRKSIVIMTDYLESSKNSLQNCYVCVCVYHQSFRHTIETYLKINSLYIDCVDLCQLNVSERWCVPVCLSIYLFETFPNGSRKKEGGRRGKKEVFFFLFSQQEATRLNETSILIFTPHTFKLYSKYCCCSNCR